MSHNMETKIVENILFLDLGRKCNMCCDYCFNDPKIDFDLDITKVKDVLSAAKKYSCNNLILTGGEPLLREDIFDILFYAKSEGFTKIKILTNGELLSEDLIKKLAGKISAFLISYHESNASKIRDLISLMLKNKIQVEFNYIINRKTYRKMIKFLEEFSEYKNDVAFYFTFMTNEKHNIKRTPELLLSFTECKDEIYKLCEFVENKRFTLVIEDIPRCVLGKYYKFSAFYLRNKNNQIVFGYVNGEDVFYKNMELGGARALKEKKKFDYCYSCIYSNECTGVTKNYRGLFDNEPDLVENIIFKGKFLDVENDLKIDYCRQLLPNLLLIKDKFKLSSKEELAKLKLCINGISSKNVSNTYSADVPLCFIKDKSITALHKVSELNENCKGCFYNKICNNSVISSSNKVLIEKYFEIPDEVKFEITNKCNNDCSYCINKKTFNIDDTYSSRVLDKETLFQNFTVLRNNGVKCIRLTGGEPLLRNDLLEILKFLKNNGFYVKLNTNLTLYDSNKENFDYVNDLFVSFNELPFIGGFDEDSYKSKMKNLYNVRKRVKNLSVSIILSDQIIMHYEELMNFCDSLCVDNVVFLYPFDILDKKVSYNELYHFLYKLKNTKEQSDKNYVFGNPLPFCMFPPLITENIVNHNLLFEYGVRSFVIDPYGNLRMNYFDPNTFGNIKSGDIISKWHEMVNNIDYWTNLHPCCINCINLIDCGVYLRNILQVLKIHFFNLV